MKHTIRIFAKALIALTIFGTTELSGISITIVPTYEQNGGVFPVEIQGQGNQPGVNNDELVVTGEATLLNTPTVVVTSNDGAFFIGGSYTILTSGLLVGDFSPLVTTNNALTGHPLHITPVLKYVGNNVLLDFRPGFLAVAKNLNEFHVVEQLESISDPTSDQAILLNNITSLTGIEIQQALEEMSGSQYAQINNMIELSNHQFIRRLYDPLRPFLTTGPCSYLSCNCEDEIDFWVDASGLTSRVFNTQSAYGFKNNGYEVGLGAQIIPDPYWIFGAAVNYEYGKIDYNIEGDGEINTLLGAFYGAYRDVDFYVVGDLVMGGSSGRVNRSFNIGPVLYSEKGNPKSFQGALYVEGGMNFLCDGVIFQPFVGFEFGYYHPHKLRESGSDPVALNFSISSYGTIDSRLGLHFTSPFPDSGFSFALDLAWVSRLNDLQDHRIVRFFDFGKAFRSYGSNVRRNSFDGSINLTQIINDQWSLYATGSGEFWSKSCAYDLTGGISFSW